MGDAKTATDLCLPWRKNTAEDDHITDEISFDPPSSGTYRFILDRHDELVAVVCVEDIDADARAELAQRVNLFLAAPDLVEALKAATATCQTFLDDCGDVRDFTTQADINDWEEIISKAEGQ